MNKRIRRNNKRKYLRMRENVWGLIERMTKLAEEEASWTGREPFRPTIAMTISINVETRKVRIKQGRLFSVQTSYGSVMVRNNARSLAYIPEYNSIRYKRWMERYGIKQ